MIDKVFSRESVKYNFHVLVVFNLSLEIAMTKNMTSVLVDKTKESDWQSIVFVHQRGEYDVTWKPAIEMFVCSNLSFMKF